jgi:hypothetical protein
LNFALMFNSRNTLIAQFRLTRFGSISFVTHVLHVQIFGLTWPTGHVFSNSRIRINLDCHVLWVQACQSSIVCSFSAEPESVVQLYSAVPSRVKYVHELVLNNVCF